MIQQEVRLLVTGDLHLGRHPTKIPPEYDSRDISPATIWRRIVERAVELKVDALLLTGDVVDRDNRFFEAFGPFEEGIKKLAENNIQVFAVSGNHDFDVLPRLITSIDRKNIKLLGKGGRWETQLLKKNGEPAVYFCGWSYPTRHYRKNPLSRLERPDTELPVIGLLHTETDNPGSNYAPVSSADLRAVDLEGWVLGHIHSSYLKSDITPFLLNPGSPQPLNPAEPGEHYVWEINIKPGAGVEIKSHRLSSLYYLNLELDVSELDQIEKLPSLLMKKVKKSPIVNSEDSHVPQCIITRLILQGRTRLMREIDNKLEMLKELEQEVDGCPIVIDKMVNNTSPPVNLEELARGTDQAALVAGYLLQLESGEELPEKLMKQTKKKLQVAYNSNAYQPLRQQNRIDPPADREVRELLTGQCRRLLEALLAQKEGA